MKILIIMRGIPWTGKSYRSKELKGDNGVIYSTDEYFYSIVNPENPDHYSFNPSFLSEAHAWNLMRAKEAIKNGVSPVIIDNTNTTAWEAKPYVQYACEHGYSIRIEEPTSDRWLEIRELLLDVQANKVALENWAKKLEEGSKETHGVPAFAIEKMMWRWENNLTLEKILNA